MPPATTGSCFGGVPRLKAAPALRALLAACLLLCLPCAADAAANWTICAFAGGFTLPFTTAAYHAVKAANAAGRHSGAHFDFRLIRSTAPYNYYSAAAKHMVKGWIVNGTECDAVLGPGSSSSAVGVSPVIEVPWLDASASSTELSNKARHPVFSRVIPTDDRGTVVAMRAMLALGWADLNVITVDYEYGRSLGEGMIAAAADHNATVHIAAKIPSSSQRTVADVIAVVERIIRDSPSRIIFVGGGFSTDDYIELRRRRLDEQVVFVFPEATCSSTSTTPSYTALSGALCMTYTYDDPSAAAFLASYKTRSLEEEKAVFMAEGITPPSDSRLLAVSLYQALNYDAAELMMAALHRFGRLHPGASTMDNKDALAVLRSTTFAGATGLVSLDSNGNRVSSAEVLLSSGAGNRTGHTVIGRVNATAVSLSAPAIMLLGELREVGAATKAVALRPRTSSDSTNVALIVIASTVVGAALIIAMALLLFAVLFFRRTSRDNAAAPKDEAHPFAIVFTDIQASTTLWSLIPEVMSGALDTHHDTLRSLTAEHKGYEVKTIGDSFMVAFQDAGDSVRFSLAVQTTFMRLDWDPSIDDAYRQLTEDTSTTAVYKARWHGLRVRVGVHYGRGTIVEDPTTKGYDYYGTVVNTAARVEAIGHGGQVLVTQEVLVSAMAASGLDTTEVNTAALGEQDLRGLSAPVALMQLLPPTLAVRTFPPLRLDHAAFVEDDAGSPVADDTLSADSADKRSVTSSSFGGQLDDAGARYAKALLSALTPQERAKVIAMLSRRWHVTVGPQRSLVRDAPKLDRAIAALGARSGRTVEVRASAAVAKLSLSGHNPLQQRLWQTMQRRKSHAASAAPQPTTTPGEDSAVARHPMHAVAPLPSAPTRLSTSGDLGLGAHHQAHQAHQAGQGHGAADTAARSGRMNGSECGDGGDLDITSAGEIDPYEEPDRPALETV